MHHRRSIRLKEYDYSMPGAYFVTIVTHQRKLLFGNIYGEELRLNKFGQLVEHHWKDTGNIRPNISLDEYVIMPNHVHGMVWINGAGQMSSDAPGGVMSANSGSVSGQYAPTANFRSPAQTIGAIIRGFKGITAKQINIVRGTRGQPVWQRNYYERVVRDEQELTKIREYIRFNPLKWESDDENPENVRKK